MKHSLAGCEGYDGQEHICDRFSVVLTERADGEEGLLTVRADGEEGLLTVRTDGEEGLLTVRTDGEEGFC